MKYLFMAISNGVDWLALYESLDMLGNWYLLGYLAYILFMVFAVINIVSGMFIERALKVVKQDRDFWIFEEKSMKYEYEDRVRGLFHQMDKDMSGRVSWEEFEDALRNPHVEAYLSFIDLDTAHLRDIFMLLDTGQVEEVDICELMDGIDRLRGPAKKA